MTTWLPRHRVEMIVWSTLSVMHLSSDGCAWWILKLLKKPKLLPPIASSSFDLKRFLLQFARSISRQTNVKSQPFFFLSYIKESWLLMAHLIPFNLMLPIKEHGFHCDLLTRREKFSTYHQTTSFPRPLFPEVENCDKTLRGKGRLSGQGTAPGSDPKAELFLLSFFFFFSFSFFQWFLFDLSQLKEYEYECSTQFFFSFREQNTVSCFFDVNILW